MNKEEVFALLEENQNERGIENWAKMKNTGGLSSYGIGLTVLRKLAKKIGRDHQLSMQLWESDNICAKTISLLIDDPKAITKEQVEQQVEGLGFGYLTHVFSACDATLAKAKLAVELAPEWLYAEDEMRQRCAYGLYYELSKKKTKALTDEYFLKCLDKIRNDYDESLSGSHKVSMGTAIMGIGKRNINLHPIALELARNIGPIDFNDEGGKCDPMNIEKHLTSPYITDKLGL